EELARRALREKPGRPDARRLLAQALAGRDQRTQAIEVLDELLRETPNDPGAMVLRGKLALEMGEGDRAISLLEAVRDRDPQRRRSVRAHLVVAYTQAGRAADAARAQREMHALQEAEVLRDALASQPDDPDVQARAGRAWLEAGQTEQG